MDIEALSWFALVVQQGSFSGAARRLNQPSSTVSRRIARLEGSLNIKLLIRTTRSIALTDEGEQLLELAQQMLSLQEQTQDWRDSLQSLPSGKLRITAPSSFARGPLAQWLIRFRQTYTQVETELIHSNEYLDFQTYQLDVAFRQGPLPSTSLVAKRLFGIEWGAFASPDWAQSHSDIKRAEDLQRVSVVTSGVRGHSLPWRFKNVTFVREQVDMLFEDSEQCIQAALAGMGCTYVSRYDALPFVERGQLVELVPQDRAEAADFYMVTSSRQHRPVKTSSFIDHIEMEIRDFGQPEGLVF